MKWVVTLLCTAIPAFGSVLAQAQLRFIETTDLAGVGDQGRSYSAAWGDYDGDGLIDLFVTYMDRPDVLYRNKGEGIFEEVSLEAGIPDAVGSAAEGAVWGVPS